MVHNSYIFSNINSWHTAPDTWLWKRVHILAKSAIFYKAVIMSTHLRGSTIFLKLYIILYFRVSFQLFSNILASFARGDIIPTRKQTTEVLILIRQRFCKRRSKSFVEKLSIFTFAAHFDHEKNSLFVTFYFRNQLIWAHQ